MPIDFTIEDFEGHVLFELKDPGGLFTAVLRHGHSNVADFNILKYIDPYDDTIFNSWMVKDFIKDLQRLEKSTALSQEEKTFLKEIVSFSTKALSEPHQYLKMHGD